MLSIKERNPSLNTQTDSMSFLNGTQDMVVYWICWLLKTKKYTPNPNWERINENARIYLKTTLPYNK